MTKRKRRNEKKLGKIYHYVPRYDLVARLASELNMSDSQVRQQIFDERLYLLKEAWNDPLISLADV